MRHKAIYIDKYWSFSSTSSLFFISMAKYNDIKDVELSNYHCTCIKNIRQDVQVKTKSIRKDFVQALEICQGGTERVEKVIPE